MSFYKIADLILEIENNGIKLQKELEDFIINDINTKSDIRIVLNRTGKNLDYLQLLSFEGIRLLQNDLIEVYEDEVNYYVRFFNASIIYGYSCSKNKRESVIYCADVNFNIFDTYNVEIGVVVPVIFNGPEMLVDAIRDSFLFHAARLGRLAIHSASIVYKDKVWLFSAMSGVGKTTHIKMWEEAGFEFEHFNGDLALIYKKGNAPMAAGMPWCGTSKIYSGKIFALGGNVSLKRGKANLIKELGGADALIELLARCVSPMWDKKLMNDIVDVLEEIVPKIASGILWCTPNVGAAEVSKKYIDGVIDENF